MCSLPHQSSRLLPSCKPTDIHMFAHAQVVASRIPACRQRRLRGSSRSMCPIKSRPLWRRRAASQQLQPPRSPASQQATRGWPGLRRRWPVPRRHSSRLLLKQPPHQGSCKHCQQAWTSMRSERWQRLLELLVCSCPGLHLPSPPPGNKEVGSLYTPKALSLPFLIFLYKIQRPSLPRRRSVGFC